MLNFQQHLEGSRLHRLPHIPSHPFRGCSEREGAGWRVWCVCVHVSAPSCLDAHVPGEESDGLECLLGQVHTRSASPSPKLHASLCVASVLPPTRPCSEPDGGHSGMKRQGPYLQGASKRKGDDNT